VLKIIENNKLLFIGIHIVIGFLATFSFFPKIYALSVFAIALVSVVLSSNNNEEALLFASYITGVEVFLRMIKGSISFEMGKYGVILLLVIGMFIGPTKQKVSLTFFLYILLLLLGIVFTQVPYGESLRKAIVFNLSGPIVLGISALYLYKRPISRTQLFELLFLALLPVFSMVTYMYFRTPDLKEIAFGGVSLGETSGGFGPNQVATILGFGMFVLGVFLLLKIKLTGFLVLDALFLMYFTYRGLLTFSRGGIVTAAVAFILFSLFIILYQKGSFVSIFKNILIAGVFIVAIWVYTSDVTGGMLNNRYTGRNASGIKKKDATSGRGKIFQMQLESFYESPLTGIGVGNGKYKRQLSGKHVTAASHNEVSRLIEEHGLVGIFILLMLFFIPISHFYKSNNYQRAFLIAFYVFWFLTINHSAMRIAFPSFIYGLSLIIITDDEN